MLHTVNKSPFEKNSFETCLRFAKDGSAILLFEDGVYAALQGTKFAPVVEEAMKSKTIYALGPDLAARGVSDKVLEGVKVVDYGGFVDLVADNGPVESWL
jgi:tRNA 2-thiouridine synthesizing protein B